MVGDGIKLTMLFDSDPSSFVNFWAKKTRR
jgi:hypothetical protein